MKIDKHILINFVTGIILLNITNDFTDRNLLFFIFGGFVFDIDHPIYHLVKYKSLKLNDFFKEHKKLFKTMTPKFYIFHTFEFIVLFGIISFYYLNIYFYLGLITHLLSDIAKYIYTYKKNFSWIKHWSFFWNIKNMKKD